MPAASSFETMFMNHSAIMLLIDPNGGAIKKANFAAVDFYGYSIDELQGMNISSINTLSAEDVRAEMRRAGEERRNHFIFRHRLKSGKVVPVEVHSTPMLVDGEMRLYSIVVDISSKKNREAELAEQNEKMSFIVEGANVGTWEWNVQSGKTEFNERWAGMLGYELQQLRPTTVETWKGLTHPDDLDKSIKLLNEHFDGGSEHYECEIRMKHKDGHWVWVHDRGKLFSRTEDGKPLMMYGIHFDISGRKQSERELQDSQKMLANLTNQVPGFFYRFRMTEKGEMRLLYASRGLEEIYELKAEELHEDPEAIFARIDPHDYEMVMRTIYESFEKLSIWECEYRVLLPEKGKRWISGSSCPEKQDDGSVIWNGFIRDISKTKENEKRLRQQKEQLDLILSATNDGLWDWNLEDDTVFLSPRWKEMLGYEDGELKNDFSTFMNLLHPKEKQNIMTNINQYLRGDAENFSHELRMLHKDGSIVWVHTQGVALWNEKGKAYRFVGSHTDITHKKEIEERLRDSEKRLRYAMLGSNEGLWDWNILTAECYFSERYNEIIGFEKIEKVDKVEFWLSRINKDDFHSHQEKLNRHFLSKTEFFQDAQRLRTMSGGWIWVLVKGKIVEWDRKDRPIRMVGTISDIDGIKKLQNKVQHDLDEKKRSIARAQQTQENLNSTSLPVLDEMLFSAMFIPSQELSGDFFNVVMSSDPHKVLIVMGDSTGHGIEASLDAALLKAVCDRHFWILNDMSSPRGFMESVNTDIANYCVEGKYPTLFAAIVDSDKKTMKYSNANSPLPYLIKDGTAIRLERTRGFHLGVQSDTVFYENEVSLEGAKLVFYSDSLFEFIDNSGQMFGHENLKLLLPHIDGYGGEYLQSLSIRVGEMSHSGFPLDDDLTLITIEHLLPMSFSADFSTADELEEIRSRMRAELQRFGYTTDLREKICVVLHELGTNALKHAHKYDTNKKAHADVSISCDEVSFSVEDEGKGFDVNSVPDPTDFSALEAMLAKDMHEDYSCGRGIWLSNQYMDSVEYNEKGNKVYAYLRRTETKPLAYSPDESE